MSQENMAPAARTYRGGEGDEEMSKDVTVIIKDEPGELAALGEATGAAGVNIQGMAGF